jgi:hypothetical protein
MLLHGDGTNGAQNNTFLDSSTNNFTITRNGNTTQGSFSPYGSNWSNYLTGSSYLTWSGTSIGTNAFTFECWFYYTGTSFPPAGQDGASFIGPSSASSSALNLNIFNSTTVAFDRYGVSNDNFTVPTLVANTWYHIAFVRNASNVTTVFLNGTRSSTGTVTSSYNYSGTTNAVGYTGGAVSRYFPGYISNARLVIGSAVYDPTQTTITVPTAPLTAIANTQLLTCQSNRFRDNSTNAFAITVNGTPSVQRFSPFSPTAAYSTSVIGGSGYFDGSTDWLSVADGSWITLGTNNFTAECWIYNTSSTGAGQYICGQGATAASSVSFELYLTSSRTLQGGIYVGSQKYATSTGTIPLNAWTHVALVRDGGNIRIYINGVQDGVNATAGSSSVVDQPYQFSIGRGGEYNASYFVGNISDYRFINGTCLYPNGTTFTPPSAPLTAVSNTQLLCNMTNGGIFDNAMMNNLETVGNAQISTSVFKYGTGSMAFDGSGDRLYQPLNQNFNFGTGDFTIELWVNPINQGGHGNSNNDCLIDFRPGVVSGAYGTLYIFSNGTGVYWYANGANRTGGGAISNGVWTHVALCRASGNTRLFLNGTQSGTTYSDSTNYLVSTIMVGEFNDGAGAGNFNGYIDDLRITKGYARYNSNFTPPAAAFPNQ